MSTTHKKTISGVYTLYEPSNPLPLVFDSPHSGRVYPDDFDYICPFDALEKAEDKYVDDLFITAPDHGATLLLAEFPRSYIDVNRCARDIDPHLITDHHKMNSAPTARSHAGIGLIRRLLRPGIPIYDRPVTLAEVQNRLQTYYHPYHEALKALIEGAHYRFGEVWHINCHSMPSQNGGARAAPAHAPDFVLGDRDGTTCDLDFTHAVRDCLRRMGYHVAINDPYKGVELVRRYSAPRRGRHSLQIEVAKRLYLNEKTNEKLSQYNEIKADLERLISFCAAYVQDRALPLAAD